MATIFTQIIEGKLTARFVWKDDECVVFLSNRPLRPGHCLVVPRQEIDHWIDLEPSLLDHLAETAQAIGRAQMAGFNFGNQDPDPDPGMMDEAAATIRRELRKLGYVQVAG